MAEFFVEIATRSGEVVDALKAVAEAEVSTTRNLTGETIVALSAALPLATVVIKEVSKIIQDRQATIRAQKLKIGKGTMSFEGFSATDINLLIEKVKEAELVDRS
jgi:hypothetical protein